MIKSSRICQIKGHQDYNPSHICTFQGCNLGTRWVCGQCFVEQIHQHNQTSNIHIINKQQFQMLLNQLLNHDNQNNKNLQVEMQSYIQQIMKLHQIASQLELYNQNCQKEMDDYKSSLSIQHQIKKKLQFNNQELLISVQQITKQLQEIEQSILKIQQQKQQITNNFSYEFKDYIKLKQNYLILTAQTSKNEQYLAYGGRAKLCLIYDLCLNKQIKSIKLDQVACVCKFSSDSQLLYIGCGKGYLYCIDIADNCKQIYQQQLNQTDIQNIKEQQHQVIITSHERDIIITNIKLQQQILIIHNAHTDWIFGLDYNKLNDVIVSGSYDKSIKFFNGQSVLPLIQKQQSHDGWIYKIKLIYENKLASLSSDRILKYWLIDYQNKGLIILNQLKDENDIINFDFINQQSIMTICKKYFKIFDQDFNDIKQIEHSQHDDVKFQRTNQLNSMNFIIICGLTQLTVMRSLKMNQ